MSPRIDRSRVVAMTLAGESTKHIAATMHIAERSVVRIRAAKGISRAQPLHTRQPSTTPSVLEEVEDAAIRLLTRYNAMDVLEALGIAS